MLASARLLSPTLTRAPGLTAALASFNNPHVIENLTAEAELLSKASPSESPYETSTRLLRLHQLSIRIEQEAIKLIEDQVVNGLGGDDGVSRQELHNLANNPHTSTRLQIAANFLLENPLKLRALETANNDSNPLFSSRDFSISMADLHARQFDIDNDITAQIEAPDSVTGYAVPTNDDTYVTGEMDTPNRPTSLYANQQDAVESAIRAGKPTAFPNSDGQTISVTIAPLEAGKAASYHVSLDGGEQFTVHSSISTAHTIEAIANVIDWGTTFNARPGIRKFPATVVFDNEPYAVGNAAATYHGQTNTITFYQGNQYISEANYNHEMGHAIGWQLDDVGSGTGWLGSSSAQHNPQDFTPVNWESVLEAATASGIDPMTAYAGTNPAEDFAESLSAYMNARDNSPAALNAFRRAYPHRSAYLERHIFS